MQGPSYQWLFADDGLSFQEKMIAFIREHFGDLLGEDADRLDAPGGLEAVRAKVQGWLGGMAPAPARP